MRVMMELNSLAAKNQILLISCIQFLKEATTCGLTHLSKKMVACIVLSKTQYVGHTLHTLEHEYSYP